MKDALRIFCHYKEANPESQRRNLPGRKEEVKMDISIKEMAEKLKSVSDEYRIVYHIRPDGDCIGSAFALALALRSIGKKCDVAGQDEIPRIHRYMTDPIPMDPVENPVYIAVDAASAQRVGTYADRHFTFCMDHHHNTFDQADYRYVEKNCGACSEIIYKLIKELGVAVTKEMANLLYTAVVTDTMCFRTTDTNAQTFEIAAELSRLGADVYRIGRLNTFLKSAGRLRCSMRSNGDISVDEICKIFGGGGHFHAACCELEMSAQEARTAIEQVCSGYFE